MRLRTLMVVTVLAAAVFPGSRMRAAGCDPQGKVKFICGMIAPEDLVPVPNTGWVIASGYTAGGAIHLINTKDLTTTRVFPSASPRLRLDTNTYASCPGPIDPAEKEKSSAHGLNLRPGVNGVHTVTSSIMACASRSRSSRSTPSRACPPSHGSAARWPHRL